MARNIRIDKYSLSPLHTNCPGGVSTLSTAGLINRVFVYNVMYLLISEVSMFYCSNLKGFKYIMWWLVRRVYISPAVLTLVNSKYNGQLCK